MRIVLQEQISAYVCAVIRRYSLCLLTAYGGWQIPPVDRALASASITASSHRCSAAAGVILRCRAVCC